MNGIGRENKTWFYLKISLVLLTLLLVIISTFFLFRKETKKEPKLEIIINGGKEFVANINSDFKDDGVSLMYGDKKVPELEYIVTTSGEVDTSKIGDYEIKYTIMYDGDTYEEVRKVSIKDIEEPEITTNIEKIEKDYCNGKEKTALTYTATDNYDGDLTDKIERENKEDKVILTVVDNSGNKKIKEIPIETMPEPAPIVKLNGSKTVYIYKDSSYEEPGYSVTDGCGKAIDEKVTVTGSVNTNETGTYELAYTVNYKELEGKSVRTVRVYNKDELVGTSGIGKTVYLTFDDGPGAYTQELLDILDKYDVKVTFFVTNQFSKYQYLIGEEAKRGHTVAVHTLTHRWEIYSSVDSYRNDFNAMNDIIENQTGKRSQLFRFPGGSSNTISKKYAKGVVTDIKNSMEADGYVYFDWNVDSGDASGAGTEKAYQNVINGMSRKTDSVVLMHDIHKTTIPAVEKIIQYGLANGYSFEALTVNSPTAHHGINN